LRTIRFCRSLRSLAPVLFSVLTLLFLFGSSEQVSSVSAQTTKTVTGLGPNTVTVNDPSFTIQVDGTGFATGDTVILSGTPLVTEFVSDKLLTAFVPANALQVASFLQVSVRPAAGGPPVGSQTLTVQTQSPSISIVSITPVNVTLNQTGISLVLLGVGLTKDCVVLIDGVQFTATAGTQNTATTLTATVTADVTKVRGFHAVQAFNPTLAAGTQISNLITLNVDVTNTKPTITSISPDTVGAGTDNFTLTINGTDFVAGAQVLFVATSLKITFFSTTQIQVIVTSDLIRTAGSFGITVENPGGVASDPVNLTVTAPVYLIQNIAPTEVFQNGPTVDVVIFGNNIPTATDSTGVTVTLNGAALPTEITVKSRTQDKLVIEVLNTAAILKTPGTVTFEVTNPATNTTDVRPFKIDPSNIVVGTFAGDNIGHTLGFVDGPLLNGARFSRPSRMAESPVDHSLWIADQQNNAVRRIAMDPADPNFGKVQTIAGAGNTKRGLNCKARNPDDANDNPNVSAPNAPCDSSITFSPGVVGNPGAVSPANNPIVMNNPVGVAIDDNNVVYVTEIGNSVIRRITPQGPPDNRSYVVDIFAGSFTDSAKDANGIITRTANPGFADGVLKAPTSGSATVAQMNRPDGIVLGKDINNETVLYIADSLNFRIRRIFLTGPNANTMDTIAGSFLGATDGDRFTGTMNTIAGLDLELDGITLDVGDPINGQVRFVNSFTGDISSRAGRGTLNLDGGPGVGGFAFPTGTALTTDGKLIVADSGPKDSQANNNAIRWLQNDGSVVTYAGQSGLTGGYKDGTQFVAQFREPRSVFVASDGTTYVCDSGNNVIRTITVVSTPKVFKTRPIVGPKVIRPQRRGSTGN